MSNKIRTNIETIEFSDAGLGVDDGTRTVKVVWNVSTVGGVAFKVPMHFDLAPGKEDKLIAYARAALHHLSHNLAEQTKDWAEPE